MDIKNEGTEAAMGREMKESELQEKKQLYVQGGRKQNNQAWAEVRKGTRNPILSPEKEKTNAGYETPGIDQYSVMKRQAKSKKH